MRAARRADLGGQEAVAAAEVEDSVVGLRGEPCGYFAGEEGDEGGGGGVGGWGPVVFGGVG